MARKDGIDTFGAVSLVVFSLVLAVNQVAIKITNDGLQPIFAAGLRSLLAVVFVGLWIGLRGGRVRPDPAYLGPGLLVGAAFTVEFVCLFLALDLTTVTRAAIIFYSMPLWLALAAHLLIPGERIGRGKALGLVLAFAGVAWVLSDRGAGGQGSLWGDLLALGAALSWGGIALCARLTRLRELKPEAQLFWQVSVSAVALLALAPLFGPLLRDLQPVHLVSLLFQAGVVVSAGFMFWFWLLTVYPAAAVASFSFLSPVFSVALGAFWLGEPVGATVIGALALVALGLWLINRPARVARAAPGALPPDPRDI